MDADVFISLTHFKGHEQTGFGGAHQEHRHGLRFPPGQDGAARSGASRWWRQKRAWAAAGAPRSAPTAPSSYREDRKASIDQDKCVGCGRCIAVCSLDAIRTGNDAAMEELSCRMAEYAKAVVDGRPQFHISLVIDVSPYCDCHGENDLPIVPDVGMFASFDPVALDQACADACGKRVLIPGCRLDRADAQRGLLRTTHDHFINSMPDTDWRLCLDHC
ncbi:MAG: DUF362 domain-containing protein [Flavonifractor plautii]